MWKQKWAELLGENGRDDELMARVGQIQYIDMSGPTTCRRCRKALRRIDGEYTCPSCGSVSIAPPIKERKKMSEQILETIT